MRTMGRAGHVAAHAAQPGGGLTLTWALQQLNRLGDDRGAARRPHAAASLPACPCTESADNGSSPASEGLACLTPSSSDARIHPAADSAGQVQQASRPRLEGQHLSVRWADALEQHGQLAHAPHHSQFAPDKPCLKQHQSSFPFLDEATQLDGVLQRPRALVLAQLNVDCGAARHALKKRGRLAAFGQ